MRHPQKQSGPPWPKDFDAALTGQDPFGASPRPSLESQIVTSLKLFAIAGAVMLALWLIDYAVSPPVLPGP